MITKKQIANLKKEAKKTSKNAHSPYSNIQVGAALLSKNNEIITGCNVENISFGGTICAERTAIVKAISMGIKDFKALYLYTKEQWSPCGLCLQVISEFFSSDTLIILGSDDKETTLQLKDLLPKKIDIETFKKLQK